MSGTPSLLSRISSAPADGSSPDTKPRGQKRPHGSGHGSGKAAVAAGGAPAAAETSGVGAHFNSMLLALVGFLKSRNPQMFSTSDLAIMSNIRDIEYNEELTKALRAHDRVEFNVKTDLYAYKPEFVIRNKQEALARIVQYDGRGGMPFKMLQEYWDDAKEGVEELERDGRVLVMRSKESGKEGERSRQIKMVFVDEMGKIEPAVDEVFVDAWKALKTPAPEDLAQALNDAGLRKTASAPTSAIVIQKKKKGGQQRRIKKVTNTHVKGVDLTQDFGPLNKK